MPLLRLDSASRRVVAIALAGVLSLSGWAQNAQPAPSALPQAPQPMPAPAPQPQRYASVDYSKPRSQFPNVVAPYKPGYVPPPNLSNTDRIQQLMHDGKIMLSMNDAVALALENNLDLVLARYNLNIADTDILRADAGANILGVNTGIVQNTPGGGVGGLSGNVGSGSIARDRCARKIGLCPQCPESDDWPSKCRPPRCGRHPQTAANIAP